MNARDALDRIEQRMDACTTNHGVWLHHDFTQCVEFAHHQAPRLIAALRGVLDLHQPRDDGSMSLVAEPYYPCATVRSIQHALECERPITDDNPRILDDAGDPDN